MDIFQVVKDLCTLSPRQGENEIETAKYLEKVIRQKTDKLQVQKFPTCVPLVSTAYLNLDGQEIPCLGCSFETGNISTKDQVVHSPHSDYISTPSYHKTPAVAISRTDAKKLNQATTVEGRVTVDKYSYLSRNFLVGNLDKPKNIIFAHYDSLGGGAIDNASSIAVCLKLLSEIRELISDNLFIFAGNEELSYDFPDYWGYGYRQFEKYYPGLLRQAKQILVIDGVGLTAPEVITTDLDNFIPLNYLKTFQSKTKVISSNQQQVLKCYHCKEDTPDKLSSEYLNQSISLLQKLLI
ncbi:hypothetical protein A2572_00035 [Candidatus Collierbacteria bacterium RIFOXYD1_FULL_40_9]|uniref:Peptidase M28 domain-containing protein n=1 Tax=Candidatus Collierbacteria bacterium RIFOXYD1_FULL_40_9 TaxID=1817731 RepID=A0A1F5FWH5_9BACT|nr:MAG: hypothetical protein A2572_00035 [Candidatus Collierbacteria bacterium RIFOXYD1_FULL_40_9]